MTPDNDIDKYITERITKTEKFVVWIGSTIHGLDDAYGPFDTIQEIDKWLSSQPVPPKSDRVFVLCLNKPAPNLFG
jgi:hypothetical protein